MKKYGWVRQLPDRRDLVYTPAPPSTLPASVDLRAGMPPVYDQGQLGSCTANAICGAIQFLCMKENLPGANLVPSRLFVYYNERAAEGTVLSDSGAMIRDGIKSVNTLGVCKESGPDSWAYSDNAWTYRIKPGSLPPFPKCYQVAAQHPAVQYVSVPQTLTAMKSVLAEGLPIVFGISVYDSFESAAVAKSGDVPMPATSESLLGGHALLCVGYDDNTQRFIFRNSWSDQWGNKGYGTIPYAYLTSPSLGSDYWAISLVK